MSDNPVLFTALLLLFLSGTQCAYGEDKAASKDLDSIQPPGGVPLIPGGGGVKITAEMGRRISKRLESAPQDDLDKWVVELERLIDNKLEGFARQGCRTHFVTRVSVAFDDLKWNPQAADKLLRRARTMLASEAKAWKEAFEEVLEKEIGQTADEVFNGGPMYAVPLVLIPVEALHEGEKYSVERGRKYLARLRQLTTEDVTLWTDTVDHFGGTALDAAVNIILLDDYFDKEQFQVVKFQTTLGAGK